MFEEADISITRPIPFGMGVRLTVGELARLGFLKWETRVRQLPMKKIPLVPVDNGFGCPPGMMWEVSSSPSRSTIDSVGVRWDQRFKKPLNKTEDSQGRNLAERNKLLSRATLSGTYVEYESEDVIRFCPSRKRGNKKKKKVTKRIDRKKLSLGDYDRGVLPNKYGFRSDGIMSYGLGEVAQVGCASSRFQRQCEVWKDINSEPPPREKQYRRLVWKDKKKNDTKTTRRR
jgi:hypothetical protein